MQTHTQKLTANDFKPRLTPPLLSSAYTRTLTRGCWRPSWARPGWWTPASPPPARAPASTRSSPPQPPAPPTSSSSRWARPRTSARGWRWPSVCVCGTWTLEATTAASGGCTTTTRRSWWWALPSAPTRKWLGLDYVPSSQSRCRKHKKINIYCRKYKPAGVEPLHMSVIKPDQRTSEAGRGRWGDRGQRDVMWWALQALNVTTVY